ncbi:DUF962 domain-containing protein [Woodsholea maritima]|uniref:DUF962 domain-containing protein n=1 Tax=Woodsholea maritima TaxID=240237 RepID=UPI00037F08B0|nr:DUF962 domain-containing protein [Woodsholea maritima]
MAERIYQDFASFWPYYLREHARFETRVFHYIGSAAALSVLGWAVLSLTWWAVILVPVAGYGFAWFSHALIERNKPATFTYPLWSLMGDYRMFFLAMIGKLRPELVKAGVIDHPAHRPDVTL